ncbi:MAG: hypothetical protein VX644_11215 [Planctomycetota bacterium]|nr:hypothetical protein [Planctomycetota bacterium]
MPRSLSWLLVVLLLAIAGVVGLWTSQRAHRYYYPDIPSELYTGTDFPLDREFERTGRYEISCDAALDDVIFKVVAEKTGAAVEVHEFNFWTRLCHTSEYRGYGFSIEQPGLYELTASSLPAGTEVHFGFVDTPAIARWMYIGILLGSSLAGLAFLLLYGLMIGSLPAQDLTPPPVE